AEANRSPIGSRSVPPTVSQTRLAWAGDLPSSRAACGMGFVATPELGHQAVALGVRALARLSHRGGLDADGKSGDGAGLLIQVPHLLVGDHAVAVLFEWDARARGIVAESLAASGLSLVDWRAVPVDPDSLGERAQETMPGIWHGLVDSAGFDPNDLEHRLYLARRRAERKG